MPSLASSSKKNTLSNKHLVTAGIVVAVILGLSFLPELLQFGSGGGEEIAVEEEFVIDTPVETKEQIAQEEVSTEPESQVVKFDTLREQAAEQAEPISWEVFTSRSGVAKLKLALRGIVPLEKALLNNVRGKRSLKILADFRAAVNAIIQRGEESYEDPNTALSSLHQNELLLTKTMVSEKVDRASRIYWSRVDLGEEIQSKRLLRLKKKIVGPFRPDAQIMKLEILQPSKTDRYDPRQPIQIHIEGTVSGNDVAAMSLIPQSTDTMAQSVSLRRKNNLLGLRKFNVRAAQPAEKETFILRITDIEGRVFVKRYQFYPRVRQFRWLGARTRGKFELPYKEGDPRLDAYFALTTKQRAEGVPGLQRGSFFGGTDASRF